MEKKREQSAVRNLEGGDIASKIDYTLLRQDTTLKQIKKLCDEALSHHFASVCVPPYFVRNAFQFLEDSKIKIATVIGFPLGYCTSFIKVEEAKKAMDDGASELDVVMNLAAFFSGNDNDVLQELQSITTLAHLKSKMVKLIIETGLLADDDVKRACKLAVKADVDFVKTSTGFNGEGASIEVIEKIRDLLPKKMKIKASGGIKTREQVIAFLKAGADRIGTSSAVEIMESVTAE
ncbi:MAG: deoxyribose-phosphate aldolase [Chitinophagales bacterium]|nr:deoxyribose-phosphate aldolase [Chitinophagales bacterium]